MKNKIEITVKDNNIMLSGHAKPDVCAAISSVMYTTVNILMKLEPNTISYTDDGDYVDIILSEEHSDVAKIIWNNMIDMFKDVSDMSDSVVIFNDMRGTEDDIHN